MTATTAAADTTIELATGKVRLLRGGNGPPLVVLHHDFGNMGWLDFHERLAGRFDVIAPDMPGYGQSDRPEWARHPRDLAALVSQLIRRLDFDRVTLVGLGFGGWVAAELATFAQGQLDRLVLVGAMGILPAEGEILDQVMMSHVAYVRASFRSEEEFEKRFGKEVAPPIVLGWDLSKEMTARVTWKPYMWSLQLPHLLKGVETPTLAVWGREDGVVPVSCGELYARYLPNARLVVLDDTGHAVDMERPGELARLITEHATS